jgi:hypothetical protein
MCQQGTSQDIVQATLWGQPVGLDDELAHADGLWRGGGGGGD